MQHPTHNPWQITGEREIYDNRWINVTEYQVITPSGTPGIYGKIHYKNRAIGIIPLDNELNTYLVRQFRFVLNQYTWEIPEGGGPLDDDPLEAAKRELLEETGLKASQWTKIQDFHLSNSVNDEVGHIYLARGLEQFEAELEETEDIIVKKVPFEEAYRMVCNNEITDSLAVAAILRVKIMLLEDRLP